MVYYVAIRKQTGLLYKTLQVTDAQLSYFLVPKEQ